MSLHIFFFYLLQLSSEFRTSACIALLGHCNWAPAITCNPSHNCFHKCAKLNIHTSQVANPCHIYWKAVPEPYSSHHWKYSIIWLLKISFSSFLYKCVSSSNTSLNWPCICHFDIKLWNSVFDPFLMMSVSRLELLWGAAAWQSICPCIYHSGPLQYISWLCRLKYISCFKSVILV